jgi:hypothetical protein
MSTPRDSSSDEDDIVVIVNLNKDHPEDDKHFL